jgi:threonine/homoserine/homoserine lactone efflux protein
MSPLIAIAGLVLVAAITPGPNNLVVLRTAARAGIAAATPAIAGIVLGGLLMLALAAVGLGVVFATLPALRSGIAAAGSLYLSWLGIVLMRAESEIDANASHAALPAEALGLLGFQFLNPKSWTMVLTAAAAMPAGSFTSWVQLAALFVAIPATCLLLWAAFGAAMAKRLADLRTRRRFDRTMGALLLASALALLATEL